MLVDRGMLGDREEMRRCLVDTNYYRLSAYSFTFRREEPATATTPLVRHDDFRTGTTFDLVWKRYCFDRQLRFLVIDAIERIEVTVRTKLSYHHAHNHGPFAYAEDPASLSTLIGWRRTEFVQRVTDETERSHDVFVAHFKDKYGDIHKFLPIWVATEIMTFRTVLTMFQNCSAVVRRGVSETFGVHHSVFRSWLLTLNVVRNICAHHGRLWNREIGAAPVIPNEPRGWKRPHAPVEIVHERMFAIMTLINQCTRRLGDEEWGRRFRALVDEFPEAPIKYMGFPPNWLESPLWANAR